MEKPTPAALQSFEAAWTAAAAQGDGAVDRKRMFGMPAAFVNGNMFMGVFANGIILRFAEDDRQRLLQSDGIGPFSPRPGGNPWKDYISVDADQWGDSDELGAWAAAARAHTAKMPVKVPKPRKKKA